MTREEFDQTLNRIKGQQPFQPFAVEMIDGERHLVRTPNEFSYNGRGTVVLYGKVFRFVDWNGVRRIDDLSREEAMKPQEFDESLRVLLRRRPFVPFKVELAEGRSFVVDDPNAVAFCNGAAG